MFPQRVSRLLLPVRERVNEEFQRCKLAARDRQPVDWQYQASSSLPLQKPRRGAIFHGAAARPAFFERGFHDVVDGDDGFLTHGYILSFRGKMAEEFQIPPSTCTLDACR